MTSQHVPDQIDEDLMPRNNPQLAAEIVDNPDAAREIESEEARVAKMGDAEVEAERHTPRPAGPAVQSA